MKHSVYTATRKRFPVFLFILIGIVLVAGTAFAAPSASLTFHYNLGGSARYGIIDNNKLYCVIGSRLFIADVADTTRPVEQGSLALPGIGRRISKKDTVLYVACTEGGMVTVDVSDPQNPKQLAQIIFDKPDAIGKTFDVAIQGSYAYVADHTGFHVVDITDPAAPVLKSSFTDFTNPRHLAYDVMIEDNYAYLCCEGDGLYIFDIRNPVAPAKVTQWKDAENNFGQFYQSARSGNYLYIAGGIKGIVVLDVADIKDPKLVSNFVGEQGVWGGAIGLVHVGSYCYIQDEFFNMHCIDVSDPAHPNETGSFNTEGHHSLGIWNDGSRVVLANSTYGIRILDTNGTQVTQLGAFRSPGRIMDCAGSGNHAYLAAGENGLKIFDVTRPERPTLAAEVALEGFANGIYVTGGRAYVVGTLGTGDDENEGGFLEVLDVQNPRAPEVTGSVEVSGEPFDVVVHNDIAYVATQTAGITLVNVADPAHPSVLATYDTTGLCYGLDLMGDFLIGADGLDGIVILDVRDPTYPKKLFGSPLLTSVLHASVWDTYGYLAGGSQGLMVVNLAVPFVPQSSAVIEPLMIRNQPAQTKASVAFNSYLFEVETIGNLGAVRLFDLQEPENPIELDGNAYLVGDPLKVSYSPEQGLAYVASQIAGLYIYAVTLSDEPQVDIEGRWLGSAGDDGIELELDQAHNHVSGTAVIVGAQTQQAVISGTISGNVFTGTMTPSGVFSLALQDNGTLTGTINDRAVLLTRIGDRGFFTLKNASARLRDTIARYKASTPPVQRVFLNIAENALDASLASTTLSGALKQAAIAHAVLDIPPVSGPIAAAYRYLYPAGYGEAQLAQKEAEIMTAEICADYQKSLSFYDTLGDTAMSRGTTLGDAGKEAEALYRFSSAVRSYEKVFDLYRQNKAQCPTYGYAELDGYYEGTIDFGIVQAKARACLFQADNGTVSGDIFIIIESTGEYLHGVFGPDCINSGTTESTVTGTILVTVGEITAHLLIQDWKYNTVSQKWEGSIEVVEQNVTGQVSLGKLQDVCPEGWNAL